MAVIVLVVGLWQGTSGNLPMVGNRWEQRDYMMQELRREAPRETLRAAPVATPAPTPIPTPAPLVYAAPVASSVVKPPPDADRASLANLVASYFPDDSRMASHVVWAESMGDWAGERWRCYVYGPCMSATSDCGLMQIHWPVHGGKFGWDLSQCFDPVRNVQVARQIYDGQGPCAWASYGC
jgi:hypothetical protein